MRNSLARSTRLAYARVLTEFISYADRHGWQLTNGDALMAAVAAFLGAKIRDGYAPAIGHQLHAALCLHWPMWVPYLRPLHRGLRGWERQRPVVKRPPLVRPLAIAMAMRLTVWGYPAMGIAILLAFHCYLRIGELLRVEPWHIVPARSVRTGFTNSDGFLHIPRAKTGTQQDVPITDSDVAWFIGIAARAATSLPQLRHRKQTQTHPSTEVRVFPYRERNFRKLFAECAASFGLPSTIVPHSLRHGGATHDYASNHLTTEQIRIRGRWKMEKAMQHYVGSMRSALATLQVPEESVWCGAVMCKQQRQSFLRMLSRAPPIPEVLAFRRAINADVATAR